MVVGEMYFWIIIALKIYCKKPSITAKSNAVMLLV